MGKRSADGVTISLVIRAKDEATAARILTHPTLRALVTAFDVKHNLDGQDRSSKPFTAYTRIEFGSDVKLRANAVKWLVQQLQLPDGHNDKIVIGNMENATGLTANQIDLNLPELEIVIGNIYSKSKEHENVFRMGLRDHYGYSVLQNPARVLSAATDLKSLVSDLGKKEIGIPKIALFEAENFASV